MKHENPLKPHRAATLAALFLLVAFSLTAAGQSSGENGEKVKLFLEAHAHYRQADDHFARNDLEGAVTCLERCLEQFPQHDRAHFLLAKIRLKQRRLTEAETQINAAKQSILELREWYKNIFRPYLDGLRGKKVDNRLRLSILGESNASAYCGLRRPITYTATALRAQDSAIDAILAAFPAQKEAVPAEYNYIHGNVHFLAGRHDQARVEYELTLEKNPRHGNASNNLANLYFLHKQYDKARAYLAQALACGARVNPKFQKALDKAAGR